jgi:N utilization substance protein B
MQAIYAMHQNNSDDLIKQEKFLLVSIDNMNELYLLMLSTLVELQNKEMEFLEISKKKHLATKEERNPNLKFVNNAILNALKNDQALKLSLEKNKINNWKNNDDVILLLLQDIKQSKLYKEYIATETSSFQLDKDFIIDLFSQIIAPNEKLYNYLEEYKLTWVDDIPVVNTQILKQLNQFSVNKDFTISKLYKDEEDKDFAISLLKKTALNEVELAKEYIDKTPNWDTERIAELDTILLKMAICEFLKFPSIPIKVTINEYLELAKEYSTPKSSIFINGILDKLVKELQANNRIEKSGRGLI